VERILDIIPDYQLFGYKNQLANESVDSPISDIALLGGAYQVATAVVALLLIFILVRYFDLFRYILVSAFSGQGRGADLHIIARDSRNIKLVTSISGAMLLALLTMRISVMDWGVPIFGVGPDLSAWSVGGLTLVGIILTLLGEGLLLYLTGLLSNRSDACSNLWHIKLLYFSFIVVVISPMVILTLLTEGLVAKIALYTSAAICSLSLILFIKETFLLFRSQRFSIFHWILYLCALEIFPLSLLLAPIARG
jgi:hypothetical protein